MVKFTQYLMPRGQQNLVQIDMPEEVEAKAKEIQDAGLVFECEVLSNYTQVSFTITDHIHDNGDVDIRICKNGPAVVETVKGLIMDFDVAVYKAKRDAMLLEGPSDEEEEV